GPGGVGDAHTLGGELVRDIDGLDQDLLAGLNCAGVIDERLGETGDARIDHAVPRICWKRRDGLADQRPRSPPPPPPPPPPASEVFSCFSPSIDPSMRTHCCVPKTIVPENCWSL